MTYKIAGARHQMIDTNGIALSVYDAGERDPSRAVVMSHGFPELAFSWRHQVRALADAGWWAIAPDQRGYGGSSRPAEIEAYGMGSLTGDLIGMLDALGVEQAIFMGHDWGGAVVWQMPLRYPERTRGVIGVNTPFGQRGPVRPTEMLRNVFGETHYILRIQEPGMADAGMAANVEGTFRNGLRTSLPPEQQRVTPTSVFEEGDAPPAPTGTPLATDDEIQVYIDTFRETGFTGGLNWYRNIDRNWEETPEQEGAKITGIPCLMVTAAWDVFLPPAMAEPMREVVDDLEIHEIDACGHWTQQEKPEELNRIVVDWLGRRFP